MGAVCLRAFPVYRSQGINRPGARTSPQPVMGGSWKGSPRSLPRGPLLNGVPQAPRGRTESRYSCGALLIDLLPFLPSRLSKWLILGSPPKLLLWLCFREPRMVVNSAWDPCIFSLSPSCLCLNHSHAYSLNSHSDSSICIWKQLII